MTNQLRTSSYIAGISLLIMTLAAIYSFGYVHTQIISENMTLTINNIQTSSLFLTGILGWGIIIVTDILVT